MKGKGSGGRKGLKTALIIIIIAAVLIGAYAGGRWLENKNKQPQTRGDYHQSHEAVVQDVLEADGVKYEKRKNVTTILLMGVDQDADESREGYKDGGQADFLRLIVIDNDNKTMSQLEIDRDTMTPITVLGILGDRSGMRTAQICLSHGFGDGKEESCRLTSEAVSNLLLGSKVDFYIAMNLDGISRLNDFVGGITVTLEDDFTSVDPTMTQGKTLTLEGDQAEYYVRSRMSIGIGTNEARMKRQQEYISLLIDKMDKKIRESESVIGQLFDELQPYLVTNMPRGRLINELWAARDYTRNSTLSLKGTHQVGSDGFMQFYVDEAEPQKAVLELFYKRAD